MKVSKLIEELSKQNPDATVHLFNQPLQRTEEVSYYTVMNDDQLADYNSGKGTNIDGQGASNVILFGRTGTNG